jgi:two-component system NarL family sensor kinase
MTSDTTIGVAGELSSPAASARPDAQGWLVLTSVRSRGRLATDPIPRLRAVLLRFGLAALAALVLVGIAGAVVSRHIAETQSVHEAAQVTDLLADSVVQPALTDAMTTDASAAERGLGELIRTRVLSDSLVRVKLWTPQGRIMYSDEPRLVNEQFGLDNGAREALSSPQTRSEISNLGKPENRFELGRGTLLEVYRPVWTPSGKPLLFETYFRYDQVSARASQLWRGFAGITLSSLAALVLLLAPLVWTLLVRARRAHAQREQMLQRAMDASLDERRRIAATLHDGVVQELAAASFTVAASAEQAAARGDGELAHRLREAGAAVRTSIGGMRSLLVDIYPPSLRGSGLSAALSDLAMTFAGRTPDVVLAIDEEAALRLTPEEQQAYFRFVQECLRNAAKHAQAATATVSLRRDDAGIVLDVVDDGVGFDPSIRREADHFGLNLMIDLARELGAELALRSEPGHGTAWRLTGPAR